MDIQPVCTGHRCVHYLVRVLWLITPVLFALLLHSETSAAQGGSTTASTPSVSLPAWAYPVNPPLGEFDMKIPRRVPGSTRQFTQAEVEDDFGPPDWHPGDHPLLPEVVAFGRKPAVRACMKCHLPNGAGHPESSDLNGLPVRYFQQQMAAFRDGSRRGARAGSMLPIAQAITEEEILAAALFFNALPPLPAGWRTVAETDTVPATFLGTGAMRFIVNGGGSEPIGSRIIELPHNPELAELRDSRSGFVALVPLGSLAKGENLVKEIGGKTIACATCHGLDLKGLGDVPGLIGRSPMYVFRQLNDIKTGSRAGPMAVLMQPVVANLEPDDMLAIAAYLASLNP